MNRCGSIEAIARVSFLPRQAVHGFRVDHNRLKTNVSLLKTAKRATPQLTKLNEFVCSCLPWCCPSPIAAVNEPGWLSQKSTGYTNRLVPVFASARKLLSSMNVDPKSLS